MSADNYSNWLKLRSEAKDEFGEHLCYCGHTKYCTCSDPDYQTFKESVARGTIIEGDENNGWRKLEDTE